MFDIILATIGALVPVALAVLGVYVTWHPPAIPSKKHDLMIAGFIVLGLTGVVCSAWFSYRSGKQLNRIEANTQTPPKVEVNIPPSSPPQVIISPPEHPQQHHISAGFMTLSQDPAFADIGCIVAENRRIAVNVTLVNGGPEPLDGVMRYFGLGLRPIVANASDQTDREVLAYFRKDAIKQARAVKDNQKLSLYPKNAIWNTLTTPPLTKDSVEGIMNGTVRLYVYAWSRWKDEPHDYERCMWLQAPTNPQLNVAPVWHACAQ